MFQVIGLPSHQPQSHSPPPTQCPLGSLVTSPLGIFNAVLPLMILLSCNHEVKIILILKAIGSKRPLVYCLPPVQDILVVTLATRPAGHIRRQAKSSRDTMVRHKDRSTTSSQENFLVSDYNSENGYAGPKVPNVGSLNEMFTSQLADAAPGHREIGAPRTAKQNNGPAPAEKFQTSTQVAGPRHDNFDLSFNNTRSNSVATQYSSVFGALHRTPSFYGHEAMASEGQYQIYYTSHVNVEKPLSKGSQTSKRKLCCGLKPKIFLGVLAFVILLTIGAIVGGVMGSILKTRENTGNDMDKNIPTIKAISSVTEESTTAPYSGPLPTNLPYELETGPWTINAKLDHQQGVCQPNPQGITECLDPYNLKFNIHKLPEGFKVEYESTSVLNNVIMIPPRTYSDWYVFNVTGEYEAYNKNGFTCNTTVDASVLLGPNYKFHVILHYWTLKTCQLDDGYKALAGQYCRCEWIGYGCEWIGYANGKDIMTTEHSKEFRPTPAPTNIGSITDRTTTNTFRPSLRRGDWY
ncbi:hypothetical protein BDZ91DRAFT_823413 [Kalaharituber pfeilii]|nr:hypothetical protein BDZ91DRAFT_823413 [Kalaharituber pfeilii]